VRVCVLFTRYAPHAADIGLCSAHVGGVGPGDIRPTEPLGYQGMQGRWWWGGVLGVVHGAQTADGGRGPREATPRPARLGPVAAFQRGAYAARRRWPLPLENPTHWLGYAPSAGSTQANTSGGIQGAAMQAAQEECATRHSMHQPVGAGNWNE
jgi:hypothetical protein